MLKNVETKCPFSLLDGIYQLAQMLGNVGFGTGLVGPPRLKNLQIGSPFPAAGYSAISTPKKARGASAWMLSFADIAPAPAQTEHPQQDAASTSGMMTIDDISAAPLEQTKQPGHPKRGAGSISWMLTFVDIRAALPGQNVQPVHPKKETAGEQSAQSAHLKRIGHVAGKSDNSDTLKRQHPALGVLSSVAVVLGHGVQS